MQTKKTKRKQTNSNNKLKTEEALMRFLRQYGTKMFRARIGKKSEKVREIASFENSEDKDDDYSNNDYCRLDLLRDQ